MKIQESKRILVKQKESKWSGTAEDAFFNGEIFDRNRKLQKAEDEYSGKSSAGSYYVVAVDVGRKGCDSVATIIKSTPQTEGSSIKSVVNIYTLSDEHFETQAIAIKKLYYKYKARVVVIDGNGIGIGLIDEMVKSQKDEETGIDLPDFGIANDDEGFYKNFKTPETEQDAVYIIKANATINTEAHANVQSQLSSGKVKFLIDERSAQAKLLATVKGSKMTPDERQEYLRPYKVTSILKEEMLNLREDHEGVNIILKQSNKRIRKDKFSSLEYGLYYIKLQEDRKKKKKRFNIGDMMFMN